MMYSLWTLILPIAITATAPPLATGQTLYQATCAYCHGVRGQGDVRLNAPRLWGKGSALTGTSGTTNGHLAQYIAQFMPMIPVNGTSSGSLSGAQASSLAHYILSHSES